MARTFFFPVWSLENSQKLLTTNQLLVSTIFFTIISYFLFLQLLANIPFFSMCFDFFAIIAKEVNQTRNNLVWIVAPLFFLFCCALTTGHCSAFQQLLYFSRQSSANPRSQLVYFQQFYQIILSNQKCL